MGKHRIVLCCALALQLGCAANDVGGERTPTDWTLEVDAQAAPPEDEGERCQDAFDANGRPCALCVDAEGVVTVNTCMAPHTLDRDADASMAMPGPDDPPLQGDADAGASDASAPDAAEPEPEPVPEDGNPPPSTPEEPPIDTAAMDCAADPVAFGGATMIAVLDDALGIVGLDAGLRAPSAAELRSISGPTGVSNCFDVLRYAIEHYGDGSFTAFYDPSAILDCVTGGSCRMIQLIDLGAVEACRRVPVGCNQLQVGRGITSGETYALNSLCSADRPWDCVGSPLVIDLDGDGLALKGPGEGATFALAGGGQLDVGWLRGGTDDALLAIDLDGSGCIEGGRELFGEVSGGAASDGFAALARYDDNHDGEVDARDAAFSSLSLWHDDGDGRCAPSEITPVTTYAIESFALDADAYGERDSYGNELGLLGQARVAGEHSVPVVDVWFRMVTP